MLVVEGFHFFPKILQRGWRVSGRSEIADMSYLNSRIWYCKAMFPECHIQSVIVREAMFFALEPMVRQREWGECILTYAYSA